MMLLQCPHCGNRMKYQGGSGSLAGKRKQCVYCGKSYSVAGHAVSQNL